jgi:hypothetical protein
MCLILDGYGVMGIFNSRTRPRIMEPAGRLCTQLGGLSFALPALFSPTARAVHKREAACVAAGGGIFENHL